MRTAALHTFALTLVTGLALTAPAPAMDHMKGTKIIPVQEIKWGPGPASLPPGAQVTVLYGDPSKEGLFALRLKFPKGFHVPPHLHPKPEVVTVLSGTIRFGMGETADHHKAQVLTAGSLFACSPEMAHFIYADEEAVIQLNSVGPFTIAYVNPKDDPRKK